MASRQPPLGAVVAGAQEVDVAQLGARLGHRDQVAVGQGQPVGLVQVRLPLLVLAPHRVDQRLGQGEARLHPQVRRPGGVGQRDRAAQGGDARVGRAGRDGRRPRLDDRLDRAVGGDLDGRARPLVPGRLDRGARRDPELVVEQRGERPVLALGGVVVAGEAVQPDDERLVVLVERAHRRCAHGEAARPVELAAGQQPERGLVQHRLGRRLEPPALGEQPRVERRRPAQHRALEQLAAGLPPPPPPPTSRASGRSTSTSTSSARVSTTGSPSIEPSSPAPGGSRPGSSAAPAAGRRPRRTAARPDGSCSWAAR